MIIEILRHTPPWVLLLFFVLLGLGYWQSRPRQTSVPTALAVPVALLLLSLYGVASVFPGPAPLLAWSGGLAAAWSLVRARPYLRNAAFDPSTRRLAIPGSWVPLRLMMAIFFTRYTVAVVLGRRPEFQTAIEFAAGVSFLYGILSGLFLAGALSLWRLSRRAPAH